MLNTHSTFVEKQIRILKMADNEMLLSLCTARARVVQKRKMEKFELEMAFKKNKTSFGTFTNASNTA